MFNLFKKKKVKVQVLHRDETKLRLVDWQSDQQLCATASKVLSDPNLQLMLSVLKNEHPSKYILKFPATIDDRAIHQARAEGYEMFMANLEALAICKVVEPAPEATFAYEGE
jgi:hypothetical protein